jgi:phosphoglycerate dehydrogenase-like enzyme
VALITAVLPDRAPAEALGALPGFRLLGFPSTRDADDTLSSAEVIVLDEGTIELASELAQFPHVRFVQSVFAGIDAILPNLPAGVIVCNTSEGVHDVAVSEWVVGSILASLRGLPRHFRAQEERQWERTEDALATDLIDAEELWGKRVLIVGHGAIGRAVEQRLAPFGVDILRVARHVRPGVRSPGQLSALLPQSHIVVLALPLTDETRGMVDKHFLAAMPDGALLVNAARGGLVEQDALLAELSRGRIRAALDVTVPEPLPAESPLWSAPNCLITPHVAGVTRQWAARAYKFVGDQLRRYQADEPLRNVRSSY